MNAFVGFVSLLYLCVVAPLVSCSFNPRVERVTGEYGVQLEQPSSGVIGITAQETSQTSLDSVQSETVEILKDGRSRVTFIVRFAHEMNGSWYPWCQKPTLFIEKFRLFSEALRAGTQYATMLWAPNLGPGYPYKNGKYEAKCNGENAPEDCIVLDTDGDGKLTAADDMFSPYWPGVDYVDWVGSSLYWWAQSILGETGEPVPDFYFTYSEEKNIAMIITETAALYNLCDKDPDTEACKVNVPDGLINPEFEFDIKSTWWDQVFSLEGSTSTREMFPNIRIISWFNVRKEEQEVGGNTIDWTTYADQDLKDAFIAQISLKPEDEEPYWITDEAKKTESFGSRVDRIVEKDGVLVGTSVEWPAWNFSASTIPKKSVMSQKATLCYTYLPLTEFDKTTMQKIFSNLSGSPSIIITPQPFEGLKKVTADAIKDFVSTLRKYEKNGLTFIVRFAPEMNGSWFPWAQSPTEYIQAFRLISDALRSGTEYATMMWAPVVGQGYPYPAGQYAQQCDKGSTSRDCKLLDTNGDSEFTYLDDMYSPYWPGDLYVDWIGAALSWWGKAYPWGENEIPGDEYFYDSLLGGGTEEISSIYKTYSEEKDIAMVITETAAMYNLCDNDKKTDACMTNIEEGWINPQHEFDIKSAWWKQVFSLDGFTSTRKAFPNIKMISWLEVRRSDAEVKNNTIDWTTYSSETIRESFLKTLNKKSNDGVRYWMTG
eukprot:jgi/Picre1/32075/NNA_007423.t1